MYICSYGIYNSIYAVQCDVLMPGLCLSCSRSMGASSDADLLWAVASAPGPWPLASGLCPGLRPLASSLQPPQAGGRSLGRRRQAASGKGQGLPQAAVYVYAIVYANVCIICSMYPYTHIQYTIYIYTIYIKRSLQSTYYLVTITSGTTSTTLVLNCSSLCVYTPHKKLLSKRKAWRKATTAPIVVLCPHL